MNTTIDDSKAKINSEFEKRQNQADSENSNGADSHKTTSKIEELLTQNDKSEIDYKNAQSQRDTSPNNSVEHPY
jgi:hypothetical protein